MKLLWDYDEETKNKIWKAVKTDKAFRVKYLEHDFAAFYVYYFGHNMVTGVKDFHKEWVRICVSNDNALIIAFRESAKTAIVAFIYVLYCIIYGREKFIMFLAYDLENAEEKVLNLGNMLRAKNQITDDYGFLLKELQKSDIKKEDRMNKFITNTGVKVQAVSLKNQKRGKQLVDPETQEILRPTFLIGDDIDTNESVRNVDIVEENFNKISGSTLKSIRGRAIFLGNIIGEDGVNIRLRDVYCKNSKMWIYSEKALIEDGEIVWPERYVWKLEDARRINEEKYNGDIIVQSIEELKVDENIFNSDFLNIPYVVFGDPVFITNNVQRIEPREPIRTLKIKIGAMADNSNDVILDLDIFRDVHEQVCMGGDIAGGVGGDYSDLTYVTKEDKLVARVRSNQIKPEQVAELIKYIYHTVGLNSYKNSIGIERNNHGIAVVNGLMDDKEIYNKIYLKTTPGKSNSGKPTRERGWLTTGPSKEIMIGDLRIGVDNDTLEIDKTQKSEFKTYIIDDDGSYNAMSGKYDDSVISRAIAHQMTLHFKY